MKTIRVHMANNFHQRVRIPPGTTGAELLAKAGSSGGYLADARGNEIPPETDLHEAMYEDQDVLVCARTNLESERARLRGIPYAKVIEQHVRQAKLGELLQVYAGTTSRLCKHVPKAAQDELNGLWTAAIRRDQLWSTDGAQVFDLVVNDARTILTESGIAYDDEDLYGLFLWITLGYATAAAASKELREQMGIRKGVFGR